MDIPNQKLTSRQLMDFLKKNNITPIYGKFTYTKPKLRLPIFRLNPKRLELKKSKKNA